jgi:flavin-dependent dehydrogenase
VGVGESIGTVFPLLGEGIIPSLQSADILCETLLDLSEYERRIMEEFKLYKDIYTLVKLKHGGKLSLVKDFPIIYRAYAYMKNREERFGLVVRAGDLRKILKN